METTSDKNLTTTHWKTVSWRYLWRDFFKRAFDVLASALGLLLLSPLFLYLAWRITAYDDPRATPLGHWLRDTNWWTWMSSSIP